MVSIKKSSYIAVMLPWQHALCPRCHAYLSARSMARNPVCTLRDLWYLRSLEEKGGHQSLSTGCVSLSSPSYYSKVKSTLLSQLSSPSSLLNSQVQSPYSIIQSILLMQQLSHPSLLNYLVHPFTHQSTLLNSQILPIIQQSSQPSILNSQVHPPN